MMMESSINSATILPPYEEEFEPVDNLHWSPETSKQHLFAFNTPASSIEVHPWVITNTHTKFRQDPSRNQLSIVSVMPNEWPEWKKRYGRYRIAAKRHKEDAEVQINNLIYCMGDEAESIYERFSFGEDEENVYDDVMDKFEDLFIPRERAIFHDRKQKEGESVEVFLEVYLNWLKHVIMETIKKTKLETNLYGV
ncbi:hypothetical protein LOTGIDRAFT_157191 [Lottia gigantea]|uniref:Uncharacterized protein n=1 Tax=Lottia gigantea TaxID=225164 RepID=V4CIP2_LOTGI|nr:hypothetical protein LOTGIDRAFT_157191 [Lottia gigantea]ESP02050.1 hypothetical protein LOTGIDRAFT_157191 [Lottia gigantea]